MILSILFNTKSGRRIVHGTAANGIGKLWVALIQIGLVPFFLRYWGAGGYGVWLLLSTIPTYLTFSDFGIASAASTTMTYHYSRGDIKKTLKIFQSAFMLLTASIGAVTLLAVCAVFITWKIGLWNALPHGNDACQATLLLIAYSFVSVESGIVDTLYRCTGRYALGTIFKDVAAPLEGLAVLAVILAGGHFAAASAAMLVTRCLAVLFYVSVIKKREWWVRLSFAKNATSDFGHLLAPSMSAFSLMISNAVSLQGLLVVLGLVFGAPSVAFFATVRTLTRTPLQAVGLLTRASVPELTRAYAINDRVLATRILRLNVVLTTGTLCVSMVVLFAFGPAFLRVLSDSKFPPSYALFLALGAAACFNAIWGALATPLLAMNRQSSFAWHYLLLSIAVLSVPLIERSLVWTAAGAAAAEALTAAIVGRAAWRSLRSLRGGSSIGGCGGASGCAV